MTQTLTPPTAVLLLEYGQQDANWEQNFQDLAARLARQLDQVVIPCFLGCSTNLVLDGIRRGVQQGAVKFVVLPLFLSPAMYRDNAIAEAVTWASRRWPFLTFHVSQPLNWEIWTNIFRTQLNEVEPLSRAAPAARSDFGLVLIGQDEDSSEGRGDLAKLGRLIFEAIDVKWVELGFLAKAYPDVDRAIQQTLAAGAKRIILQPTFLFGAMSLDPIIQRRLTDDEVQFQMLPPSDQGTALLNALIDQYFVTLEDDRLLPLRWDEVRREVEVQNASHQPFRTRIVLGSEQAMPADEVQFQDLTARINAILPPRYQNQRTVSAAPMAAAELQFDVDGAVAWDKMWGLDDPDNPFCELALAGGPPHRGDLLEPALAEVCLAESGKYAAVLAELTRGINLVAGLSTVESPVPGWIGVQCTNEAMAIWLLRAIIVENVMVRRENTILYLPAGPHFTLTNEIKTVVTVVAKTVHYWHEHRTK